MGFLDGLFKPNIARLEARRDVPSLIKALSHADADVRSEAAQALGHTMDASAVEPLGAALKDKSGAVRASAAYALGDIGGARAAELLLRAPQEPYLFGSDAVTISLAKLGDAEALELVCAQLRGNDSSQRWLAAYNLAAIGDARAVGPLVTALNDSDPEVRDISIVALRNIRDPSAAVKVLTKLLLEDGAVSKAAVLALDQFKWQPGQDEAAARYWIAKGNWDNCAAVGAAAVNPLLIALETPESQAGAAKALVRIGAPAVEPLIKVVKGKGDHVYSLPVRLDVAALLTELHISLPTSDVAHLMLQFVIRSQGERSFFQGFMKGRDYAAKERFASEPAVRTLASYLKVSDDLVIDAMQALGSQVGWDQYDPKYGSEVLDMQPGRSAVERLCAADNQFTTAVLKRISARNNVTITLTGGCSDPQTVTADFSEWRQLARQELIRRGAEG